MKTGESIAKLLALASAPLSQVFPIQSEMIASLGGPLTDELMSVLESKNGFYAFESALHFFPAQMSLLSVGIDDWNSPDGWRKEYNDLAEGCLFFAEDVFGGQFCISSGNIYYFDPETGDRDNLGSSLDEWAKLIISDFEFRTGYPLAHEWQTARGVLAERTRLMPKTPFVCKGAFAISNLVEIDGERSMRVRGNLARQIHDLPDGAQIKFEIR
jgi:hypothetical protein